MPVLALRKDDEGWRFLGMEGAHGLVVPPSLLERNVGRYQLDNIEMVLDLVNDAQW